MVGAVTARYKQMDIIICDHNAAASGVTRLAAGTSIRKYAKDIEDRCISRCRRAMVDADNNNNNNNSKICTVHLYCILATPDGDM
jgi:hypothetical protein